MSTDTTVVRCGEPTTRNHPCRNAASLDYGSAGHSPCTDHLRLMPPQVAELHEMIHRLYRAGVTDGRAQAMVEMGYGRLL